MALGPRLDLRQHQTLVMTPQLRQAIKLLQYSNIEVATFVEEELERNPLLERDDSTETPGVERSAPDQLPERSNENIDVAQMVRGDTLPSEAAAPLDTDFGETYDAGGVADGAPFSQAISGSGGAYDFEGDDRGIDDVADARRPLREHLGEQLRLSFADPVDRMIGAHLIALLCPAGRLTAEPAAIADAMAALLENLDLLARRELRRLTTICGVDMDDLAEMIAEIRTLDPKPAANYESVPTQLVVPDILMRSSPDGGWLIELNPETMPRLLVNERFYARVAPRARKEDRLFLAEHLASANWLVRSLQQRAQTILKVSAEIIRQQDGFMRLGVAHLRPLILRDIAEAVEMHESTVSRVTANKYIATPRGTFELKYFFTTAIPGTDGASHSAEAVRFRIRALIDAEAVEEILSDDAIVAALRNEGVDIARRTVAKYREALHIPNSVQRRREKAVPA
jgi:RNA polymerase sigma-54 factor